MYGLDLFSGIGGLTRALEGYVRPLAYCEIDPYCTGVLLSRMASGELPSAPIWDDVRTLRGSAIRSRVDIIYGGFPCQDISCAGLGKGLEGERSGLFFEVARLVSEIRPRFVFLENVSAITVRGAERVVGELCGLRYDCRWGVLSASDVGAPHRRNRWFLLAHSEGDGWGTRESLGYGGLQSQNVPKEPPVRSGGELSRQNAMGKWPAEPGICRVANGIPNRMDRIKALGNAVVPQQAREAFERLSGLKAISLNPRRAGVSPATPTNL